MVCKRSLQARNNSGSGSIDVEAVEEGSCGLLGSNEGKTRPGIEQGQRSLRSTQDEVFQPVLVALKASLPRFSINAIHLISHLDPE